MGRIGKDLTGQRFCRLTVVQRAGTYTGGNIRWECLCDCGMTTFTAGNKLTSGKIKSCGCWAKDASTIHGMRHSSTYNAWSNMLNRCRNPKNDRYLQYGGRGITVCERWGKFENFLEDMGGRPEGLWLDRKDNDGNYCLENCRWATTDEQMNNKQNTRRITFQGKTQSISQWAREVRMSVDTLYQRLVIAGWSPERALTEPARYSERTRGN